MEASYTSDPQQPAVSTINPQALSKTRSHNPHQSKRFNPEEWENWMQWDGALDSLAPKSPSNSSSASIGGAATVSHGSTSPSEAESLPLPPLTPLYRIPSIDEGQKLLAPSNDDRRHPTKKRKTSAALDGQEGRGRQPKGQKISHNVIEKRYRTNLNDKIARLRDSVPVLKTAFEASQKQTNRHGGESGSDDSGSDDKASLSGLKFNKATVLTKATEYIEQLEKANARLASENTTLRRRVRHSTDDVHAPKPLYFRADEAHTTGSNLSTAAKVEIESSSSLVSPVSPGGVLGKIPVAAEFQRLRAEAADQPSYAPSAPTPEPLSPSPTAPSNDSLPSTPAPAGSSELIDFDSVKGTIPVPDYIARNRIPISQQQHYAPPTDGRRDFDSTNDTFVFDDEEPRAWWPRNRASKLLLGSLAGLMIMEGFNANVESSEPAPIGNHPHPKRGLLPDDFYTESRGFRAQIRQRIIDFAHSPRGRKALPVIMLASIILSIIFLAFIYWSRQDPKGRRRANSVSSNPERDSVDAPEPGAPLVDRDPLESSSGFGRASVQRGEQSLALAQDIISEAWLRLKGSWHVLTTGDTFHRQPQWSGHGDAMPRMIEPSKG